MSLLIRRIIFYGVLIIFIIAAPIIIIYTAGYRYNFKQKKFLKTGAIIITTNPSEAAIWLNNRLRQEQTPARLLNLTPGDYALRLTQTDYHSWEKIIKVESEQATFIDKVTLFKKTEPKLMDAGAIIDVMQTSQNGDAIYLKQEGGFSEIWRLDQLGPHLIWRDALTGTIQLRDWSNKSQTLLLTAGKEWFILSDQPTIQLQSLKTLTGKPWDKIVLTNFSDIAFGISNENLYSLNFKNGNTDFLEPAIRDVVANDENIVILQEQKNNLKLKIIKNNQTREIIDLPIGNYQLRSSAMPWLAVYNQKADKLLLINQNDHQIKEFDGKDVVWLLPNNDQFIAYTDSEIWHSKLAQSQQELLGRLSQKVDQLFAHPSGNAFIFITDNLVKAAEMDTRGQQNVYTLATFDKIYQTRMDSAGKTLLVTGIKEKTAGLWRLELR